MALHLVTGYAGKTHITSADQGALHAAVFGRENYIVNTGNCFSASTVTSNLVKILDGEVIMQGRQIRLEPGDYAEVTIENGTQEYFRNDLICIRYTKDADSGIENASFVVIKGNPDASSAIDPEYQEGNILDGILTVDLPLYRVPLNGLNIGDLVPLFETKGSMDERTSAVEKNVDGLLNGTKPAGTAKNADNADTVNGFTVYKSLAELGLDEATATPESIVTAMQNDTMLIHACGASATTSPLELPINYGLLQVTKRSTSYADFVYSMIDHRYYAYYNGGSTRKWGGWSSGNADTVDGYHATDLMSTLKTLKLEGETVTVDLFDNTYNNRIVEIHTKAENTSNIPPTLLADDKAGVGFSDGWIHGWMITLSIGNWSRKIYISLRNSNNYECWEKYSNSQSVWSAWKSYLPLTGGTLTGGLTLSKDTGDVSHTFYRKESNAQGWVARVLKGMQLSARDVYGDATNERRLYVYDVNGNSLAKALQLVEVKNSTSTAYDVLHTGNSAKVVVSETPLTAEGSIRVW